jgi:hypothetical protein
VPSGKISRDIVLLCEDCRTHLLGIRSGDAGGFIVTDSRAKNLKKTPDLLVIRRFAKCRETVSVVEAIVALNDSEWRKNTLLERDPKDASSSRQVKMSTWKKNKEHLDLYKLSAGLWKKDIPLILGEAADEDDGADYAVYAHDREEGTEEGDKEEVAEEEDAPDMDSQETHDDDEGPDSQETLDIEEEPEEETNEYEGRHEDEERPEETHAHEAGGEDEEMQREGMSRKRNLDSIAKELETARVGFKSQPVFACPQHPLHLLILLHPTPPKM